MATVLASAPKLLLERLASFYVLPCITARSPLPGIDTAAAVANAANAAAAAAASAACSDIAAGDGDGDGDGDGEGLAPAPASGGLPAVDTIKFPPRLTRGDGPSAAPGTRSPRRSRCPPLPPPLGPSLLPTPPARSPPARPLDPGLPSTPPTPAPLAPVCAPAISLSSVRRRCCACPCPWPWPWLRKSLRGPADPAEGTADPAPDDEGYLSCCQRTSVEAEPRATRESDDLNSVGSHQVGVIGERRRGCKATAARSEIRISLQLK